MTTNNSLNTTPSFTNNVWTIPPHRPFLTDLARGVWDRYKNNPASFHNITLILPTKGAFQDLEKAFHCLGKKHTLPMPQLVTMDRLQDLLPPNHLNSLPTPLTGLDRLWQITQFLPKETFFPHTDPSPTDQLHIAQTITKLLDQLQAEQVSLDDLKNIVPEEHAAHWTHILSFLEDFLTKWPNHLSASHHTDPLIHHAHVIDRLINHWENWPHPIILAGSTGSWPTTKKLMSYLLSRNDKGHVVLPGVATFMDLDVWEGEPSIDPAHPQYGLAETLAHLKTPHTHVRPWFNTELTKNNRWVYFTNALTFTKNNLNQNTLSTPATQSTNTPTFNHCHYLPCTSLAQEAMSIALILKNALRANKRAALICGYRPLTDQVQAYLKTLNITAFDQATVPLRQHPVGQLISATLPPIPDKDICPVGGLFDTWCHPLTKHNSAFGHRLEQAMKAKIDQSDIWQSWLNTPANATDLTTLQTLWPFEPLSPEEQTHLLQDKHHLAEAFGRWITVSTGKHPLSTFSQIHQSLLTDISVDTQSLDSFTTLGLGFFDPDHTLITLQAYQDLIHFLLDHHTQAKPTHTHQTKLFILGPLEARLREFDVVILGGLNEGTWPPDTTHDLWFNNTMREACGLPPTTRRIGLSAHDFVQLAQSPTVYLTRNSDHPAPPSRWLLQLESHPHWLSLTKPMQPFVAAAQTLVTEGFGSFKLSKNTETPTQPNLAVPPLDARPTRLSITDFALLRTNPYGFYCKKILHLPPSPVWPDSDHLPVLKGILIHNIFETFHQYHQDQWPLNAFDHLMTIAQTIAGTQSWFPLFDPIAKWFVTQEQTRRFPKDPHEPHITRTWSEIWGTLTLPATPHRPSIMLYGKADRIEQYNNNTLRIIDYKTGTPPTGIALESGYAPQLPLEALMAQNGGFAGVPALPVSHLEFWHLKPQDPKITSHHKNLEATLTAYESGIDTLLSHYHTLSAFHPTPQYKSPYDAYGFMSRDEG
jgi:ATP-dependent helicase/nuclease subunit B